MRKTNSFLLSVGQPLDFEERLSLLLPGTTVISTRDFPHAASLGAPSQLDVILFEVTGATNVPPPMLQALATPTTVWTATLRTRERPNLRELYGVDVKRVFQEPIEPEHIARQLAPFLRLNTPSIGLQDKSSKQNPAPAQHARHGELLQVFLARSRSRLATMLAAVASGQAEGMRQVLAIDAHRMVGTLGTFGYPHGTEPARTLEEIFSKEESLTANDLQVIEVAARHILQMLSDDSSQVLVPQQASGPTVCLLSPNDFLRMEFSASAPEFGYRVIAPPLSGFAELLAASHQFDMAVFDFGDALPDPSGPLQQVVEQVSCNVVAVCPPLSLQQRFELSKLPLDTVAEGPLTSRALAGLVAKRLRSPTGSRVIALDDDQVYLAKLDIMLRPLELNFLATERPEELWMALETRKPDMVILDINMPRYDGLQVCRAIKTNPRFEDLPVVFVCGQPSPELRQQAFAVGGDDFVEKTVNPQELRIRIVSRLRRARAGREVAVDELTTLATRESASKSLEQMLTLASLRRLPVALCLVNFDKFKAVNDKAGRASCDHVLERFASLLKNNLREEDVLARWGGDEFVVGMFLTDKESAREQMDEILEKLKAEVFTSEEGSEFTVSFSAGTAQYPLDGVTLEAIYQSAERALSMAKLRGRSRVVAASANIRFSEPVDVIILENDQVLGKSIVEALESSNIKTVWFQDGAEARVAMLSSAPYLSGKVLIVENSTTGMRGLTVVQELKEAERLGASCVITCSDTMNDDEVQAAFELGTFDHLCKPFSIPALVRNVKRGLERYRYHDQ